MKIQFDFNYNLKKTSVLAVPGEYDAVPDTEVLLYAVPYAVNPDRLAVASVLLFHSQISGELVLEKECSVHVSNEIARFFSPNEVRANTTLSPVVPSSATKNCYLIEGVLTMPNKLCDLSYVISFLEGGIGAVFSSTEVHIATNRSAVIDAVTPEHNKIIKDLGLLTIIAEDFDIKTIFLNIGRLDSSCENLMKKVKAVLKSVGLDLVIILEEDCD